MVKTRTRNYTTALEPTSCETVVKKQCLGRKQPPTQLDYLPDQAEWYSPDPQYVSDYMNDIMHCYRESEGRGLPKHGYLSAQTDINEEMREILINWVVESHEQLDLRAPVLYATVQLIDRFLSKRAVTRGTLPLVGIAAMLISSKMEDIYPPSVLHCLPCTIRTHTVRQVNKFRSCTPDEIIQMQLTILNALKFDVAFPTAYMFGQQVKIATHCDERTSLIASFLMEMALQDYATLRYSPSAMAAACVNLAERVERKLSFEEQVWTAAQEQWVGHTEVSLSNCMQLVNASLTRSQYPKLKAVRQKYSKAKYGKVAQFVKPLSLAADPSIEIFNSAEPQHTGSSGAPVCSACGNVKVQIPVQCHDEGGNQKRRLWNCAERCGNQFEWTDSDHPPICTRLCFTCERPGHQQEQCPNQLSIQGCASDNEHSIAGQASASVSKPMNCEICGVSGPHPKDSKCSCLGLAAGVSTDSESTVNSLEAATNPGSTVIMSEDYNPEDWQDEPADPMAPTPRAPCSPSLSSNSQDLCGFTRELAEPADILAADVHAEATIMAAVPTVDPHEFEWSQCILS